jgi:hypothetical protein
VLFTHQRVNLSLRAPITHLEPPIPNHTSRPNPKLTHKSSPKSLGGNTSAPPPQYTHVDHRVKSQKTSNPNSPIQILFAIQRKITKFPQCKVFHLVTQFSVHLRELPFFERSPKNSQTQNPFQNLSKWPKI